jgi:ribosomal protein S20
MFPETEEQKRAKRRIKDRERLLQVRGAIKSLPKQLHDMTKQQKESQAIILFEIERMIRETF